MHDVRRQRQRVLQLRRCQRARAKDAVEARATLMLSSHRRNQIARLAGRDENENEEEGEGDAGREEQDALDGER